MGRPSALSLQVLATKAAVGFSYNRCRKHFLRFRLNSSKKEDSIFAQMNSLRRQSVAPFTTNSTSLIRFAGYSLLAVYTFFCAWYFRERICFADTSHMLFKLIRLETFNIEAGRYPQIITQVLPLVAIYLKLPLTWIMMAYSISFPLLYAACAALASRWYHFKAAPIVLIFALTAPLTFGFYHAGTETHQALAWATLFFAWLRYSPSSEPVKASKIQLHMLAGLVFLILTMHSHPAGFFMIIFSIGYHWIETRDFKNLLPYIMLFAVLGLSLAKVGSTDAGSYEGQFLSKIPQFPELLSQLSDNWSLNYFIEKCSKSYRILWIVFLLGLVWLLLEKRFLRALYYLVFNVGFLLFTLLIYSTGDSDLMMERAFMPLGFFLILPIIDLLRVHKHSLINYLQIAAVFVCFYFSFAGLNNHGSYMTSRLRYMDELHEKFGAQKIALKSSQVDMQRIHIPWPYCFESLIYSASRYGADSCFTIAIYHDNEFPTEQLSNPLVFLTPGFFGHMDVSELKPNYFVLPETPYLSIE